MTARPAPAAIRWELLRALGAVADSPAAARTAGPALGLGAVSTAEHTSVFVLNCPPYAAVYLGPDGALGGEGADRVAGFWRVIGISPPAEPDHLAALLGLYTRLGEAAAGTRRETTAAALARSQAVLLAEHLWPWLPSYLDAVTDLDAPALTAWARLTQRALAAEFAAQPAACQLPLALRSAPGAVTKDCSVRDLTGALTTPVRSGMILTRHRLAAGAGQAGAGYRIGERRFTLRAMLEQDPAATLSWASAEAGRWESRHARRTDPASQWWAARAAQTGQFMRDCTAAAAATTPRPAGAVLR
jgi:Nitrate reductase delta subunit